MWNELVSEDPVIRPNFLTYSKECWKDGNENTIIELIFHKILMLCMTNYHETSLNWQLK